MRSRPVALRFAAVGLSFAGCFASFVGDPILAGSLILAAALMLAVTRA